MEKTRFGWYKEASKGKKALIIVGGVAIIGGIGYCAYRWGKKLFGKKAEKPAEQQPAEQK